MKKVAVVGFGFMGMTHSLNIFKNQDLEDGFYNEIDYFKECLVNNSKSEYCTPESALDSIELCYQHLT
jgi:hypothetical protein